MFKAGDIVEMEDGKIGIVAWDENKRIGAKKEDNMLGVDLLTHSRGFTTVKGEKCRPSCIDDVVNYYLVKNNELRQEIKNAELLEREIDMLENENRLLKELLKSYL